MNDGGSYFPQLRCINVTIRSQVLVLKTDKLRLVPGNWGMLGWRLTCLHHGVGVWGVHYQKHAAKAECSD